MTEHYSSQLVRVFIPDVKAQKCIVLNVMDTVWTAKQVILDKIYQELTLNPLNYGLYLPATGIGKLGKFMNDSHLLIHYALEGNVPKLELRYKRRDYTQTMLTEKAITRANSKANQRKLMEYTFNGSIKKIEKLLEAGLDPNFSWEDGNTPLGVACGRNSNTQCIMPLLSGGAHIDFRGKEGLTPMHRAAIGGNAQAINVLLSLGASPNYRDAKGLTPLYHTAIMGDEVGACISLLRYRAEIGIRDQGGWTELHQTAKYGHTEHADLLVRYGADINAQNLVGNTPLHVAASHGETHFAMLLLKRGADKTKPNYAGQSPSQVSVLCGQHQLASEINLFEDSRIDNIKLAPDFNPNAKIENKLFDVKRMSEICPIRPPNEQLVDSLAGEWGKRSHENPITSPMETCDQQLMPEHLKAVTIRNNSDASVTSKESFVRVPDSGVGDTESVSSLEMGSNHSGSTGTPSQGTPNFRRPSFLQQRERLYRAGPGKYVVIQDVESQQRGDLTLRKGMTIDVTFIGKGGFWEGKVDGKEGWFPRLAIKELNDDEFEYATLTRKESKPKITAAVPIEKKEDPILVPKPTKVPPPLAPVSEPKTSSVREVKVTRGSRGYGFAMRGVRATKSMQFNPTPEVPALQYVGSVEEGGSAAEAGLRKGDFIVAVNGFDTTLSTHDEVVNIVRNSGGTLIMKVLTPTFKSKSVSQHIRSQLTPVNTPGTEKKEDGNSNRLPRFSKSGSPLSTSTFDEKQGNNDRETVIGDRSPSIPRVGKFEWDSMGEESPKISRKVASSNSFNVKQHHEQESPLFRSSSMSRHYQKNSPNNTQKSLSITAMNMTSEWSKTLPASSSRNRPDLSKYATSESEEDKEEEERDSTFAAALRESREKLRKKSSSLMTVYKQDVTPSSLSSPPYLENSPSMVRCAVESDTEDTMSPLQLEILKASKERHERLSMNKSRVTDLHKDVRKETGRQNSLVEAMSQRLDSMKALSMIQSPDESDDDFESSPNQIASETVKDKLLDQKHPKVPPPATKPKPSKPKGAMDSPTPLRLISVSDDHLDEDAPSSPLPWEVKLRPTRKKSPEPPKVEVNSGINWKMGLKSGDRGATVPTQTKSEKSYLKVNSDLCNDGSSGLNTAGFILPPPLPDSGINRMSFIDLAPPDDFVLEMSETNTNSILPPPVHTPPPQIKDHNLNPPSPIPPCLPESSPPSKLSLSSTSEAHLLPDSLPPPTTKVYTPPSLPKSPPPPKIPSSSTFEIFILPETQDMKSNDSAQVSSLSPIPLSSELEYLPSPIPSPISSPVRERPSSSTLSASPIPPPSFDETNGFWINEEPQTSDILQSPTLANTSSSPSHSPASETPPPLPSEPPPQFDSDTSLDIFTLSSDATPNKLEENYSPRSSSGSSPQEYEMMEENCIALDSKDTLVEDLSVGLPGNLLPKVAPEVTSKPSNGFSPLPNAETTSDMSSSMKYKNTPLQEWSVGDVCEWLEAIGLSEYISSFKENEMMGEHLVDITKEDLKELGVKKLGHQKTFLSKLSQIVKY